MSRAERSRGGFWGWLIRNLLLEAGILFVILLGLCFTPAPWRVYRWLGTDGLVLDREPDRIVVLGGGGIPSESGLMRTYKAAEQSRRHPQAAVVIALPVSGPFDASDAARMRDELVMRGVAQHRITFEAKARNTREQALRLAATPGIQPAEDRVLIVTSPEHMRRALLSFRQAGFGHVASASAFSHSVDADLRYQADELGGDGIPTPGVGESTTLRYAFWNNLSYEVRAARELFALAYYRLKGWI